MFLFSHWHAHLWDFYLYVFVSFAMFNSGDDDDPTFSIHIRVGVLFWLYFRFCYLVCFFMFVFLATLTDFCFVFTRWYIDICLTFVLLLFENHITARLLAFLCSFFSLGPSSAYRFSPHNIHFLLPLLQLLCFVSTSYEIFTGSIQHCYIFHRLFCLSVYRAVSV